MAAAVSDYTPAKISKAKIKKSSEGLTIKLKPTTDILKWAGKNKKLSGAKSQTKIVVGFALEDKNLRPNAEKKLTEKNVDMIIANTPTAIGANISTVQIKTAGGEWITVKSADKNTIARKIIRFIEQISRAQSL